MSDCGTSLHVTGRKRYRCEACYGPIPKGEQHWHFTGKFEGCWQNWRMHDECMSDYRADDARDGFMPGSFPMPERVAATLTEKD